MNGINRPAGTSHDAAKTVACRGRRASQWFSSTFRLGNTGRTKSAFAPRKHVFSRSEKRQFTEVILPAFPSEVFGSYASPNHHHVLVVPDWRTLDKNRDFSSRHVANQQQLVTS